MTKMNSLSVKHLVGIRDLTKEDINTIFTTADSFKQVINRPIKKVPSLRDITIANLFFIYNLPHQYNSYQVDIA